MGTGTHQQHRDLVSLILIVPISFTLSLPDQEPTMPAPLEYYRVQDNSSATRFDEINGFIAGDPKLSVRMSPCIDSEYQNLSEALDRHLDWSNRTPSPFISVYAALDTAYNSAVARVRQGKKGVFIAHIAVKDIKDLSHRHVPELAREIGLGIQPPALRNAEQEFIFLHSIPAEAVNSHVYFK